MSDTIIVGPTAAARSEFIEWLRGVLVRPEQAERHAVAAIAEHDWSRSRSLEIRGYYTTTGAPADYEFAADDLLREIAPGRG